MPVKSKPPNEMMAVCPFVKPRAVPVDVSFSVNFEKTDHVCSHHKMTTYHLSQRHNLNRLHDHLKISPKGNFFVSAAISGGFHVFDVLKDSWTLEFVFRMDVMKAEHNTNALAWSDDERFLAYVGKGSNPKKHFRNHWRPFIAVLDFRYNRVCFPEVPYGMTNVNGVCFLKDSHHLVITDTEAGKVKVLMNFNYKLDSKLISYEGFHIGEVFSITSERFLGFDDSNRFILFDVNDQSASELFTETRKVYRFIVDAEQQLLFYSTEDGYHMFDLHCGEFIRDMKFSDKKVLDCFNPDGQFSLGGRFNELLVVPGKDGKCHFFSYRNPTPIARIQLGSEAMESVIWVPNSNGLVICGVNKELKFYHVGDDYRRCYPVKNTDNYCKEVVNPSWYPMNAYMNLYNKRRNDELDKMRYYELEETSHLLTSFHLFTTGIVAVEGVTINKVVFLNCSNEGLIMPAADDKISLIRRCMRSAEKKRPENIKEMKKVFNEILTAPTYDEEDPEHILEAEIEIEEILSSIFQQYPLFARLMYGKIKKELEARYRAELNNRTPHPAKEAAQPLLNLIREVHEKKDQLIPQLFTVARKIPEFDGRAVAITLRQATVKIQNRLPEQNLLTRFLPDEKYYRHALLHFLHDEYRTFGKKEKKFKANDSENGPTSKKRRTDNHQAGEDNLSDDESDEDLPSEDECQQPGTSRNILAPIANEDETNRDYFERIVATIGVNDNIVDSDDEDEEADPAEVDESFENDNNYEDYDNNENEENEENLYINNGFDDDDDSEDSDESDADSGIAAA